MRSYTPIPLLLFVIYFAQPTDQSLAIGFFLMVAGELIRIWGVGYAGYLTRTRNVGADALVTAGPFARVRNPLYVGNFILSLGVCVAFNTYMPAMVFVYCFFFFFQYYFIVKLEETALETKFGEAYVRYKARVPRFVPGFSTYDVASAHTFNPGMALKSEKKTLISFSAVVAAACVMFYLGYGQ